MLHPEFKALFNPSARPSRIAAAYNARALARDTGFMRCHAVLKEAVSSPSAFFTLSHHNNPLL